MRVSRTAISLLVICVSVMAQSERGNITGIVTSPSGAAVGGADLAIVNRDTKTTEKVVTTGTGEYNAPICCLGSIGSNSRSGDL
jgi:hypothetical protein